MLQSFWPLLPRWLGAPAAPAARAPTPATPEGQDDPAVYPEEELDVASAYLMLPGSALKPDVSDSVQWSTRVDRVGCIYPDSGNACTWWSAPIYLPSGAILTRLRVFVYDTSTQDSTAAFRS